MRTNWIRRSVILPAALLGPHLLWCQTLDHTSKAMDLETSDKQVAKPKKLLVSNGPAEARIAVVPEAVVPVSASAPEPAPTESASEPASLFDTLASRLSPATISVEVHGVERDLETSQPEPFSAGGQEVLSTAGAYGDISRFLQVIPGVVATSDLSNEILVRGGHPMENFFLVDGIEVPNINHLATPATTGGFAPMIDAAVIQEIKLYTGGYEARYPERLSSVTEIRTLDAANP